MDAGRSDADSDGGEDDAGEMCTSTPEQCNRDDDDCDGRIDEDTTAACERIILNAEVQCVPFGGTARCVRIECRDGYVDCDGNPANGCEPFCACNPCEDAGTDDAGSEL